MRELSREISVAQSLTPTVLRTASASGATVDLATYEGATFIIDCGVITDGTHTVVLQESDTDVDGNFTAIADADLVGSEPAMTSVNDSQIFKIGYTGSKRYVRTRVVVTDAPQTGGYYVGNVIRSRQRHNPTGSTQV